MKRLNPYAIFAAVMAIVALGAFNSSAAPARAKKIEHRSELCFGPRAEGRLGDYLLENSRVRLVIAAPGGAERKVPAGAVIDAGRPPFFLDPLVFCVPTYALQIEAPLRAVSVEVASPGGTPEGNAAIVVRAVSLMDKDLTVETRYELSADSRAVRVVSTLRNAMARPLKSLYAGDVMAWGDLRLFVPDYGLVESSGECVATWLGGYTRAGDACLGVASTNVIHMVYQHNPDPAKRLSALAYLTTQSVVAGAAVTWERYLLIADRNLAAVSDFAYRLRGDAVGTVEGAVLDGATQAPLADCPIKVLSVRKKGERESPFTYTISDDKGHFRFLALPGSYFPWGEPLDRPPTVAMQGTRWLLPDKTVDQTVLVPPAIETAYSIIDEETSRPCPAKLTFAPIPPTPPVDFGLPNTAKGGSSLCVAEGRGTLRLPSGNYDVFVSRGPEFEVVKTLLQVKGGQENIVRATLRRVVDTRGWICVDFGAKTRASYDGLLTPADRLITAAAEGVEIIVTGDDGVATDLSRDPVAAKLAPWVKTVPGKRIRFSDSGRPGDYLVFPVPPEADHAALSKQEYAAKDSRELTRLLREHYPGALVQLNEASVAGEGLFAAAGYDPFAPAETRKLPSPDVVSHDFDLLEIVSAGRLGEWRRGLHLAVSLMRTGSRFGVTGSSFSRGGNGMEIGYPRVYVPSSTDDPAKIDVAEILRNLKAGKTLITNGPFARVKFAGAEPGAMGAAKGKSVDCDLVVQRPLWVGVEAVEILSDAGMLQRIMIRSNRNLTVFPQGGADESPLFPVVLLTPGADQIMSLAIFGAPSRWPVLAPRGWREEDKVPFLAITGPVLLDGNGDGRFDPGPLAGAPGK
ncbi:MAG: hypothetical protein NTX50_29755 [Candidatus Sumerlaeota bacterium]|nr:hypothetical protein [Candidatus Sumerlaeota bacterium]